MQNNFMPKDHSLDDDPVDYTKMDFWSGSSEPVAKSDYTKQEFTRGQPVEADKIDYTKLDFSNEAPESEDQYNNFQTYVAATAQSFWNSFVNVGTSTALRPEPAGETHESLKGNPWGSWNTPVETSPEAIEASKQEWVHTRNVMDKWFPESWKAAAEEGIPEYDNKMVNWLAQTGLSMAQNAPNMAWGQASVLAFKANPLLGMGVSSLHMINMGIQEREALLRQTDALGIPRRISEEPANKFAVTVAPIETVSSIVQAAAFQGLGKFGWMKGAGKGGLDPLINYGTAAVYEGGTELAQEMKGIATLLEIIELANREGAEIDPATIGLGSSEDILGQGKEAFWTGASISLLGGASAGIGGRAVRGVSDVATTLGHKDTSQRVNKAKADALEALGINQLNAEYQKLLDTYKERALNPQEKQRFREVQDSLASADVAHLYEETTIMDHTSGIDTSLMTPAYQLEEGEREKLEHTGQMISIHEGIPDSITKANVIKDMPKTLMEYTNPDGTPAVGIRPGSKLTGETLTHFMQKQSLLESQRKYPNAPLSEKHTNDALFQGRAEAIAMWQNAESLQQNTAKFGDMEPEQILREIYSTESMYHFKELQRELVQKSGTIIADQKRGNFSTLQGVLDKHQGAIRTQLHKLVQTEDTSNDFHPIRLATKLAATSAKYNVPLVHWKDIRNQNEVVMETIASEHIPALIFEQLEDGFDNTDLIAAILPGINWDLHTFKSMDWQTFQDANAGIRGMGVLDAETGMPIYNEFGVDRDIKLSTEIPEAGYLNIHKLNEVSQNEGVPFVVYNSNTVVFDGPLPNNSEIQRVRNTLSDVLDGELKFMSSEEVVRDIMPEILAEEGGPELLRNHKGTMEVGYVRGGEVVRQEGTDQSTHLDTFTELGKKTVYDEAKPFRVMMDDTVIWTSMPTEADKAMVETNPDVEYTHLDMSDLRGQGVFAQEKPLWTYPEEQTISSAATSINETKLPATFQKLDWVGGTINADIGGGRFDNATEYLNTLGVKNIIYDPFNRTKEHNNTAAQLISDGQADTATVNNVLNVIAEPAARDQVIRQAANAVGQDGTAYFLIYEKDKTGSGVETTKGWQENRSAETYIPEINKYFDEVTRKGNLLIATEAKSVSSNLISPENQNVMDLLNSSNTGQFPQMSANRADRTSKIRALDMKDKGKSMQEIRTQTGWEEVVEGIWLYEIDFDKVKLNERAFESLAAFRKQYEEGQVQQTQTRADGTPFGGFIQYAPLDQFLDSPELFQMYPELNDVSVRVIADPNDPPHWDKTGKILQLNVASKDRGKGAIDKNDFQHELQHALFDFEDVYPGDSPANVSDYQKRLRQKLEDKVQKAILGKVLTGVDKVNPQALQNYNETKAKLQQKALVLKYHNDSLTVFETRTKAFKEYNPKATQETAEQYASASMKLDSEFMNSPRYEVYQRIRGEAFARLSELRARMTPGMRRKYSLRDSLQKILKDAGYLIEDMTVEDVLYKGTVELGSNPSTFHQDERGLTTFTEDGKAILHFFSGSDVDTHMHELGHVFFKGLTKTDLTTVAHHLSENKTKANPNKIFINSDTLIKWTENPSVYGVMSQRERAQVHIAQEYFANNFVSFLRQGKAPTPATRSLFNHFSNKLKNIYKSMNDIPMADTVLSTKMREIFNKMIDKDATKTKPPPAHVMIEGHKYQLHRSKGRTEKARIILHHMELAHGELQGLKQELSEYAQPLRKNHVLEVEALINRVKTKQDLVPIMNELDKLEAKDMFELKKKAVTNLRDTLKKIDLKRTEKKYADAIRAELADIDMRNPMSRKESKLAEATGQYMERFYKENAEMLGQLPKQVIENVKRLSKTNIYDMSPVELEMLTNMIRHLNHLAVTKATIKQAGLLHEMELAVVDARDILKKQVKGPVKLHTRGARSLLPTLKHAVIDRTRKVENLAYYMDMCEDDGVFHEVFYENIDKGEEKASIIMHDWERRVQSWTKDYGIANWSKVLQLPGQSLKDSDYIQLPTLAKASTESDFISSGAPKITKAQRVSLYLYRQNENGLTHLLEGGFRDKEHRTVLWKFDNLSQIDRVLADMTPQEVGLAKEILNYYETVAKPMINNVSMELMGYELAQEENYFPLFVEWLARGQSEAVLKAELNTQVESFVRQIIERSGFLKERTGAANPIYLPDVFEAMHKNVHDYSKYVGLAKPLRIAKAVVFDAGIEPSKETGEKIIHGVKPLMQDSWGDANYNILRQHITNIEGDVVFMAESEKFGRRVLENFTYAVLGWNVTTAAIQPVSYLMLFNEMSPKYVLEGLKHKSSVQEMSNLDIELRKRFLKGFDKDIGEAASDMKARQAWIGQSTMMEDIKNIPEVGLRAGIHRVVKTRSLDWIKSRDASTLGHVLEAVKAEQTDLYPEADPLELRQRIKDRMRYLVRQTQPVYDVKDRAEMFNSQKFVDSLLVKFMTQPTQNRNQVEKAYQMWKNGKLSNGEAAFRIANATIINALIIHGMKEGLRALRDVADGDFEEEEHTGTTFWTNRLAHIIRGVGGMLPGVSQLSHGLANYIERGAYGASFDRGIFSGMTNNLYTGFGAMGEGIKDGDVEKIFKGSLKIIETTNNMLLGYSPRNVGNIAKYLKGFGKIVMDDID